MRKIITYFDQHILRVLTVLFLIIIPLYPKFPIVGVNNTHIAVRLEDFYVGFMSLIFGIQVLRKKVTFDRFFLKYILIFWVVCMCSFLLNAFVTKKIPFTNQGLLHTLRRVEYMIPFFVAYAAFISEKAADIKGSIIKNIDRYFYIVLSVVLIVCLYALGQKSSELFQPVRDVFESLYMKNTGIVSNVAYFFFRFFDFPAVQTMNAEFAKGSLLILTPFARVSSTFAGHYDLAAYLVFFIPFLAAYVIRGTHRVRSVVTYVLAILTLIFTASRISFGAFFVSIVAFGIYTRKWKLLIGTILLTTILMYTNSDMTQRFRDMFQQRQVFENTRTGEEIIHQDLSKETLPAGSQFIKTGKGSSISNNTKALNEYKQELVRKEIDEARKDGRIISQQQAADLVAKKYLDDFKDVVVKNVVAGDTSLATRTQVEWPRALKAFLSNPLLGTGPSSITESTDGDLFRWLGETGLLGTGLFIFILVHLFLRIYRHILTITTHDKYLFIGICAGMIALAINATLIDVFEASKIAFTFWTVMGLVIATIEKEAHRSGVRV
ncbi:MAG: hypothetical protein WCO78_00415 [Candidatus Roizmanbacteria bacterium]